MKRFMSVSTVLSLALALGMASCSKPYSPNLPAKIETNPLDQLGCVMASISRNKTVEPHFRTYEFIFKSRDSALSKLSMLYRADYSLMSLPEDDTFYTNYDENGFAGIVYMRTIPVGTYYVDKAKFVGQAVQLETTNNQSQPFTIQAGACTYIGEIRVTPTTGKGLMGHTTLKSANVDIVDSWERDYLIFKKIYPELDKSKVQIQVLHSAASRIGVSVPMPSAG
ncbi:MAG: hypothetical protein H7249_07085 [Chitinophagaceae bacterium]|nr:hypothetical protein [Oligoflexus sp.]